MSLKLATLFSLLILTAACGPANVLPEVLGPSSDDEASSTLTTLVVSQQVVADGVSTASIQVVFRNAQGRRLAGRSMTLVVSGAGNVLTPCGVSNSNGISSCTLTSTVAETKTVTATGDFTLRQSIIFTMKPSKQLLSGMGSGGNYQKATSGQRLMTTIGSFHSTAQNYDSNGTVRLKNGLQGQVWKN